MHQYNGLMLQNNAMIELYNTSISKYSPFTKRKKSTCFKFKLSQWFVLICSDVPRPLLQGEEGVFTCRLNIVTTNEILLVNLPTIFNNFTDRTRFPSFVSVLLQISKNLGVGWCCTPLGTPVLLQF